MTNRPNDPPLKVSRDVPLPWLIGTIVTLIIQAVSVWISVQNQGQAIRDLTVEIRELRKDAAQGGLKVVEHDLKLLDHERRIAALEKRP